jgi:hypothetical protein
MTHSTHEPFAAQTSIPGNRAQSAALAQPPQVPSSMLQTGALAAQPSCEQSGTTQAWF